MKNAIAYFELSFRDPIFLGIFIAASLVLVALFLVLYFTVFAHRALKRQVRELNRRYEYFHGLLFGQDSSYIKHIENIAMSNLTYVNAHAEFSRRFKEIRDQVDANAQIEMNNLKDYLSDHDYKSLKAELNSAKSAVDACEKEINSLNNDLLVVIRPGEECRQASFLVKEKMRKIKQDYYLKQSDLSLASSSFDKAFAILDENFASFETLVESAQYEEAKVLLPKMEAVINEIAKILVDMPNLCATIQILIPERLTSLSNRYDEMCNAGYPLHHLINASQIQDMHRELDNLSSRVQAFNLEGVHSELDAILARIDEYFAAFDVEKDARVSFEAECEDVYQADTVVENSYIRLSNALPDVKRVYLLPDDMQEKVDSIKTLINETGATKRSLDTLIHSGSRQPYTILLAKMKTLREESSQASQAIEDFNRGLLSLRSDAEESYRCLFQYDGLVRAAEAELREIDIPSLTEKYVPEINALYAAMDDIQSTIVAPIAVAKLREAADRLRNDGERVIHEIHGLREAMYKAEASLLYANRKRKESREIAVLCEQGETHYFAGNFEEAYQLVTNGIRDYLNQ